MLKRHKSITNHLQESRAAVCAMPIAPAISASPKDAKHSVHIRRILLTTCIACMTSTSHAAMQSGSQHSMHEKDVPVLHTQQEQHKGHQHNKSATKKDKKQGHKTSMHYHTKQKQHHANTVNRLSNDGLPSVYYKGTAFNFFGDVDFHYAFSNNDDEFQAKRYNREHYMATTYSIGGEFDYALNADTRVGAIIALGASKDKRYALDLLDAQNNAAMQQPGVAITARTTSEKPYVDNEVSNFAYPIAPPQQDSVSSGGGGGGSVTAPITGGTASLTAHVKQLNMLDSAATTTITATTSGAVPVDVDASSLSYLPTVYDTTSAGPAGTTSFSATNPPGGFVVASAGTTTIATLSAANPALTYAAAATPAVVTPTVSTTITQPVVAISGSATGTFATSGTSQFQVLTLTAGSTNVPVATGVSATTPTSADVIGWSAGATALVEAHPISGIGYNVTVPAAGLTTSLTTNTAVTASLTIPAAGASGLLGFSGAAPAPAGAPLVDFAKLDLLPASSIVVTLPALAPASTTEGLGGTATAEIADGTDINFLGAQQGTIVGLNAGTTNAGDTSGTGTVLALPVSGTISFSSSGLSVNSSIPGLASSFNDVARLDTAKATLLHSHLERASVYVESKFGRFEAGREDGPEVKMRHDAASIARATGGVNGSWYYYANLGGVIGRNLNEYGLQSTLLDGIYSPTEGMPAFAMSFTDFFYHPATYLEFHLENAPKVSYYTPDFGGFRVGASYMLEQADDSPYTRFANRYSDSYHNIFTGAAEYSFTVNDIDLNASVFGEFAKHNDQCATTYSNNSFNDQCVKNYHDLQTFGLGGKVSFAGFSVAGSFVNMTDSGQKLDLAWNPDWYASYNKLNSTGAITPADQATKIYNTRTSLYATSERKETKRGIPDKISLDQLALVQIGHSQHGTTEVYTYNSAGVQQAVGPINQDATGGIVLNQNNSLDLASNLFAGGPATAGTAPVDLKIMSADIDDEYSGTHDSYYWTLGIGYEMGPAGFSVTYMDSRTQQKDAWGGRSKLRNIVAGLDYEIAKGFVPYIEVAFFKTEDKTYGFLDIGDTSATGLNLTSIEALQDTLFGKLYGSSIYPYDSTGTVAPNLEAVKKSIVDENTGYTVMVGAKMSF